MNRIGPNLLICVGLALLALAALFVPTALTDPGSDCAKNCEFDPDPECHLKCCKLLCGGDNNPCYTECTASIKCEQGDYKCMNFKKAKDCELGFNTCFTFLCVCRWFEESPTPCLCVNK